MHTHRDMHTQRMHTQRVTQIRKHTDTHIEICTYTDAYTQICAHTDACTPHQCTHTLMHTHGCREICTHRCAHTQICTHTDAHTQICTHMDECTHTNVHTQICTHGCTHTDADSMCAVLQRRLFSSHFSRSYPLSSSFQTIQKHHHACWQMPQTLPQMYFSLHWVPGCTGRSPPASQLHNKWLHLLRTPVGPATHRVACDSFSEPPVLIL